MATPLRSRHIDLKLHEPASVIIDKLPQIQYFDGVFTNSAAVCCPRTTPVLSGEIHFNIRGEYGGFELGPNGEFLIIDGIMDCLYIVDPVRGHCDVLQFVDILSNYGGACDVQTCGGLIVVAMVESDYTTHEFVLRRNDSEYICEERVPQIDWTADEPIIVNGCMFRGSWDTNQLIIENACRTITYDVAVVNQELFIGGSRMDCMGYYGGYLVIAHKHQYGSPYGHSDFVVQLYRIC